MGKMVPELSLGYRAEHSASRHPGSHGSTPPCVSSWDLLEEVLHQNERAKNIEREKP